MLLTQSKSILFKKATLCIAINTALLASVSVFAADSQDNLPTTTLPTITIVAEAEDSDDYTALSTASATGLDIEFKENPKTVTVITEELIEDQQLNNVEDVVNSTAGLSTYRLDANRTEFYSRGFRINDFFVDGMRTSYDNKAGEGGHLSTTAIYDKVEIVKGANGLMAGSGNPSATINFTRKRADNTDFEGEVAASYDKFGTYGATLDIGSKLNNSGSIRGRAIFDYTDGDTFVDREERANKTAYGVVDIDVTDDTVVSLGAMHQEKIQDGVMWGGLPIFYTDGSKIDWDVGQSNSVDWQKREGITDEVFASIEHYFNKDWQLNVNTTHADTDTDMNSFYVNGYVSKPDGLVIGGKPYILDFQSKIEDFGVNAELTGDFSAFNQQHKLMLGADYNRLDTATTAIYGTNNPPVTGIVDNWDGSYPMSSTWDAPIRYYAETEESALYGSVQLNLTDPLSVILGSRVSNYEKYIEQRDGSKTNQDFDGEWTPFIGVTYDINDNATVFASYTDIFNPQSQRKANGDYLDPIIGKNIEIGIKGTNNAETLQAQFSVFDIEQDNLAQRDYGKYVAGTDNPASGYPGEDAYFEADGAHSRGIEAEVLGKLNDNWQASLGYINFDIEDANGDRVDTKNPHQAIKLFTTYDMSDMVTGLSVGGGVEWQSERYSYIPDYLNGRVPQKIGEEARAIVNLMANYAVNDNLDIQVNVNNALDKEYPVYVYNGEQVLSGEPLNVTGKITYKW